MWRGKKYLAGGALRSLLVGWTLRVMAGDEGNKQGSFHRRGRQWNDKEVQIRSNGVVWYCNYDCLGGPGREMGGRRTTSISEESWSRQSAQAVYSLKNSRDKKPITR